MMGQIQLKTQLLQLSYNLTHKKILYLLGNNSETLHHKRDSKVMHRYRGTHEEKTPYLGEINYVYSEKMYHIGSNKYPRLENRSSYIGEDQYRELNRDKSYNCDINRYFEGHKSG